jgi:hypothetical protein
LFPYVIVVPTQSEFQDAYNSAVTNAQETARLSEEREDDKNKKREKKKAKKLSKLVKVNIEKYYNTINIYATRSYS